MKTNFLLILTLAISVFKGNAQSPDILLGSYWNGNVEIFTSLDISTKTFTDLDTLHGVQTLSVGQSTFDANNNRYFNRTNLGITIINAQTGEIIDTIANLIGMKGIEFDPNSNKLLGSYWNGNVEIFTSLDISTKTFTDLDTLHGVQTLSVGQSTFDANNNRYFNRTNLGITIINAQTGEIIDTIANLIGMKGIEFDPNSNKLLGSYWNGNVEVFTSLDISTKTFTDLDTLHGVQALYVGQSTFDVNNNRYFNRTNLGITIINAQTGAIIDTIANSIGMKGIEYVSNTQITGINPPNNQNTMKVFPNPASTHITIDYGNFNAMSGYTLTILNSIGQTVFTTPINQQTSFIDLSTWTGNGIYFVQLIDPQNNTIENRKIVIQ